MTGAGGRMDGGLADFAPWLERWGLEADGWPFGTPYTKSLLLPVRRGATPAMLKIAGSEEEARGAAVLAWWAGEGAAPVLAHAPPALLMARAPDPDALPRLALEGDDDEATAILCQVAQRLHARRPPPPPGLPPLDRWFRALRWRADEGGLFAAAWAQCRPLLADPQDSVVLHGDITHVNVLNFGPAGWLAIDPKGLSGERGYDYANLFRSPALAVATPARFRRQLALVADLASIEPSRLHRWVIGHGALSAAWHAEDGGDVASALAFVEMALAQMVA